MPGLTRSATAAPTRVLVVDDSAIVRKLLTEALRGEPDFEVVGAASDPFMARDLILRHEPDVMTLDIEMPRMDGLTFLGRLMAHHPLPVIIVSSLTQSGSAASVEALRLGAIDVIPKPGGPYSVGQVTERLKHRIRGLRSTPMRWARSRTTPLAAGTTPASSWKRLNGIILIGASTGGTQAIEGLLTRLPADGPPIAIVQHMPAAFTRAFADRLNATCPMQVREAAGGEWLERGVAYIAPGDRHMLLQGEGLRVGVVLKDGPLVQYQRPAVDVLFHSAARLRGTSMVALLLTGMGADGADGLLALRQMGATTLAEDEQSCVVFGMPREAIARGAACEVVSLWAMPSRIEAALARLTPNPPGAPRR